MSSEPSVMRDDVLRSLVDGLTSELRASYPDVEAHRVHDIVLHAAVEFYAAGYSGPHLRRQIHRRADAQLRAITGRPLAIRSAPPLERPGRR